MHNVGSIKTLLLAATAAGALTCGSMLAQDVVITPKPDEATNAPVQAQTAAEDQSPITVFRVNTRVTSVDVVVTGEKGKPLAGLSRSDFKVYEDGVLQPVKSFDAHTPTTEVPYQTPKLPTLPPNTYINLATAPTSGTPTVLLYDVLNTPLDKQGYAHEEMVNFIKHRKPGTQIAIFVLSGKLRLLQGFTDNGDLLTASLDRDKGHTSPSTQLAQAGTTETTATSLVPAASSGDPRNPLGENTSATASASTLQTAEAEEQSYLLDQRVEMTLAGLTEIGRFLAALPGRKNLVWLSASFPAGVLPDSNISVDTVGQDLSTRNFGEEVKEATDLLNVSHVAVYPVDVRGVVVDSGGSYSAASSKQYGPGTQGSTAALVSFASSQASSHSTMDSIAENTGGRAYYGTNDLQSAIDRAMENGSTYYSLTYSPTNKNFDGGLRKIRVVLDKPGYQLSYRKVYYADDLQRAVQEVQDTPQSPLSPSLERGAPVSHELFVEARLQAVGAPVQATPKQLEMLAEYESFTSKKKGKKAAAAPTNVLMQNYLITYGLLPRQLELQAEPGGAHKASIELGVLSYDQDGRKLNGVDTKIENNIPAQQYAKLSQEGYHLYQTVEIPVAASSVRLAVRDTQTNQIGSLEVPLPLAKP
jgi:VWFA-related protein